MPPMPAATLNNSPAPAANQPQPPTSLTPTSVAPGLLAGTPGAPGQSPSPSAGEAQRDEHGRFTTDAKQAERQLAVDRAAYRKVKGLPPEPQDHELIGKAGDTGDEGPKGKPGEPKTDASPQVRMMEAAVARQRLRRDRVFTDAQIDKMDDAEAVEYATRIAKRQDADDEAHREIRRLVPGWKPGGKKDTPGETPGDKPAPAGTVSKDAHDGSQPDLDSDLDTLLESVSDEASPAKGDKLTPKQKEAFKQAAQRLETERFMLRVQRAVLPLAAKFPELAEGQTPEPFVKSLGMFLSSGQYDHSDDQDLARAVRDAANHAFATQLEQRSRVELLDRQAKALDGQVDVGNRAPSASRNPTEGERLHTAYEIAKKFKGDVRGAQARMNALMTGR